MTSNQIPIRTSNLEALSHRATVPQYDRGLLIPSIVHIGAGGFNRSHLAVYLDDLLGRPETERWGECGIGLLPADMGIHSALAAQDHLYSVLTRDAEQQDLRIIGSIVEHLYAPAAGEVVLERLSSPECAIVSLTVTEGGYFIEHASKIFLSQHPDIQFDLAHPSAPKTFLGYLAEAADRRMRRGLKPFTVMSCDNLQGNGMAARDALLAFADLRNSELRRWIEQNVAFPNSMVDRITPGTSEADKEFIETHFGISDQSPVVAEPFRQWVIEDTFSNGRPAWELAGAQITSDVVPFELIKMRLLNGGHSTIAYVSALLGITFVSQAMEDPLVHNLLTQFLEETTPVLPQLPGMDLVPYKASILHRFSNPTIRDQIPRICSEGSAKIAKFIVPTIRDLHSMGKQPKVLPLVIACWLDYLRGMDEAGNLIPIVDASASAFSEFTETGSTNAALALSVRSVFGDLSSDRRFAAQVQDYLNNLHVIGVRATIRQVLNPA